MQRALIVDDNPGFRVSARLLLEPEGFAVDEADSGAAAVAAAAELHPDLVLLDVQLPDLDGFAVAEQIALLEPPPDVILTSTRDRADYGSLVTAAPALGFIAKHDLSAAAIRALRADGRARESAGG